MTNQAVDLVVSVPPCQSNEIAGLYFKILKYKLRATESNMTWIRKVFLLIQESSLIPTWIDRNNVIIVEYKDFIPSEYLPLYNLAAIEMFLQNIPDLSDVFVYTNCNVIPIAKMSIDDFFVEDCDGALKVKNELNIIRITNEKRRSQNWFHVARNSYRFARETGSERNLRELDKYEYPSASGASCPMLKGFNKIVFDECCDVIIKSITKYPERKNFNRDLFSFSAISNGLCVLSEKYNICHFPLKISWIDRIDKAVNGNLLKEVILSEMEESSVEAFDAVCNIFEQKYCRKRRYEYDV